MHYRAIVHYHFKKGMEEQAMRFLENELIKKAPSLGCHGIKLLVDENDHSHVLGIGTWDNIEEARKFQSHWEAKEKELTRMTVSTPKHEFFKLKSSYIEKNRKVA
jgi:hypothetical protein